MLQYENDCLNLNEEMHFSTILLLLSTAYSFSRNDNFHLCSANQIVKTKYIVLQFPYFISNNFEFFLPKGISVLKFLYEHLAAVFSEFDHLEDLDQDLGGGQDQGRYLKPMRVKKCIQILQVQKYIRPASCKIKI